LAIGLTLTLIHLTPGSAGAKVAGSHPPPEETVMTLANRLACAALVALLPAAASAQQSVNFWLAAQPGNIQGCIAADPQFTREHTFTLKDGQAEITAPGNIKIKMKPVRANVYDGDYALGQLHLHFVADLSVTPRTLNVTEKNLGCKWAAKKE
jgi:hypothetical protein